MSTDASARHLRAGALMLLAVSLPCRALDLTGTLWEPTGKQNGLDPVLLSAIALLVTGQPSSRDGLTPWAWTPGTEVGNRLFESRQGTGIARDAMAQRKTDVDVGLLRIDLERRGHRVADPASFPDVIDRWRASAVLDLVAGPESRGNYNAWYREAQQQEVQLADLTIGEVGALQAQLVRRNGGSAIGRYQIIDDTLDGLVARMGLTGKEPFTPALQDRMALQLARDAGLNAWLAGTLADARFAANLARVWAGLPGDHQGRSVYAGIQGNRATIGWRTLVAALCWIRSDIISR